MANMYSPNTVSPIMIAIPRCSRIAAETTSGRSRVQTRHGNAISRVSVNALTLAATEDERVNAALVLGHVRESQRTGAVVEE